MQTRENAAKQLWMKERKGEEQAIKEETKALAIVGSRLPFSLFSSANQLISTEFIRVF